MTPDQQRALRQRAKEIAQKEWADFAFQTHHDLSMALYDFALRAVEQAERDTRERCARVAETRYTETHIHPEQQSWSQGLVDYRDAGNAIAEAIRALE